MAEDTLQLLKVLNGPPYSWHLSYLETWVVSTQTIMMMPPHLAEQGCVRSMSFEASGYAECRTAS